MKKKGFTLIELLVVIAIIAMLLAVLMPALKKAKEAGKTVACSSNIKQWGMIVSYFVSDHGDRFPDSEWDDNGGSPRGMWWMLPLRPYYRDVPDILICTKASRVQDGKALYGIAPAGEGGDGKYIAQNPNECWGRRIMESTNHSEVGEWIWASVAPNSWIMDPSRGRYDPLGSVVPDSAFWGKFTNIRVPSRVPIFLDSRAVDGWPHDTDIPASEEFSDLSNMSLGYNEKFYGASS